MSIQEETIIGVYKITNIITHKYYIGYSKNIYKRFYRHRDRLKNNSHGNINLQRSYNKYTLEAFTFEILHIFDNIEDAKSKELEYLRNLEIKEKLYNIHYNNSGGDTLSNHPDKENIIKRITTTITDNYSKMTEQEKKYKHGHPMEKNGMFGKTHTEKTRKIISEKNKGIPKNLGFKHSNKMKEKLSKIAKNRIQEKNPFYGKTHTEEFKKRLSESRKGKTTNLGLSITIDNIIYNSLIEASEKLKIPVPTISWRIKSKNSKFINYNYTHEEPVKTPLSTKISINNVEYNSVKEAHKKLNFSVKYISKRLNSHDEEDSEWKILNKPRDKRVKLSKTGMIPNKLHVVTGDTHIYSNHVQQVKEQLSRNTSVLPVLVLSKDIATKDYSEMTIDDFEIIGYFPIHQS